MLKIPQIHSYANLSMFEKHTCHNVAKLKLNAIDMCERDYIFSDTDYEVTINGKTCPTKQCRVSAIPFNRAWPGKQRDISQTELAAFTSFESDESVTVKVKIKKDFEKLTIRPLSKKADFKVTGDEVEFELKSPGAYTLEPDSDHGILHIFFNPVKEEAAPDDVTYYFGPGFHFPGKINLRSGESVYIASEAVVYSTIHCTDSENIRIFGGGILDGSGEERVCCGCYEIGGGTLRVENCKNVTIEDITILNSSNWVAAFFYCEGVTVDNIKILGQWRYNTDGIDIVNSKNVTVKNSFIRSFDDSITIKGIRDFGGVIENITVDNCVLWCNWGHTLELGIETYCKEYKNITFKNCNAIHVSGSALAVLNGNTATIHDVTYENINVEFQKGTLRGQMQMSDDDKYTSADIPEISVIIAVTSDEFWPYEVVDENGFVRGSDAHIGFGDTYNISFKNINAYTDSPTIKPEIRVKAGDENTRMENITIEGLSINEEKQSDYSLFKTDFVFGEAALKN